MTAPHNRIKALVLKSTAPKNRSEREIAGYREFEERVGTIRTGKGSKTEQIKMAVNRRIGPFAISDIESDCPGISRDMIRIVLRQLRDEKAIIPQGKGRGAKWIRKKD